MSNLDEIKLLKNTLKALDTTHRLFRPLLSLYFIRAIVEICVLSRAEPSYYDLDAFMTRFKQEFLHAFLNSRKLPFHPNKCRVIQEKCDFATKLFQRVDEVLKSKLGIMDLKGDVASFDHGEHVELRKELMAQGSSARKRRKRDLKTTIDDLPTELRSNIAQSVVDRRALRLASKNFSQTLEHLECVNAKELEIMRQSQVPPCKNTARVMYKSDMNMQRAIMCAIMSPDNKLHVYVETDHLEPFLDSQIVKCFDKNYKLKLTLLYPAAEDEPLQPEGLRCNGGFRPLKVTENVQRGSEAVRFTGELKQIDNYHGPDNDDPRDNLIELLNASTVERIGDNAFDRFTALVFVDMPALTKIGNCAFQNCRALAQINMPALQEIGDRAFDGTQLRKLGDMLNLTTIGKYAFYNTPIEQLGDMPLLETIGDSAFALTPLAQLGDMPSLTTIKQYAFAETRLAQLGDMMRLEIIGHRAFFHAKQLKKLGGMPSVTRIGQGAFEYTPLEKVGDFSSLRRIGNRAFYETNLTQLGDMENLTTIGDRAFVRTPLQQLGDMKNLTTIGEKAFAGCQKLSVVRLPKTLKQVGKDAFKEVRNLGQLTVQPGANFFCECGYLADKLKNFTDVRVENGYRIKHSMNDVKKAAREDNGSDTDTDYWEGDYIDID